MPIWRSLNSNRSSGPARWHAATDINARRTPIRSRAGRLVTELLVAGACVAATGPACVAQAGAASPAAPYTEKIAGTLVTLDMMPVPAGTIQLRDGEPAVTVGPFWISKTEVTWDLYDVYVFGLDGPAETGRTDAVARPSRPYILPGDQFGHDGHPALGMSLHAAREFARWMSEKTGHKYRLPTEAEWVHACTAGKSEPPAAADLGGRAWHASNANDQTHRVGTLPPNAHGVHDMLGNAAEWVIAASDSAVMGGAFASEARDVSCRARRVQVPAWNATDPQLPKSRWWLTDAPFVGLRLVRDP